MRAAKLIQMKNKLKLLDDSNQFQIKAYININKSTEIDSINLGVKEPIKLQEFLKIYLY